MTGRMHYYLSPVMPAMPLVTSGRLLALGVTTSERVPLLPEVPTLSEAALPNFRYDGWFGLWAPGKTSRRTIDVIAREVGRILVLPDVGEKIVSQGAAPKSGSPAELDQLVRSEVETRAKVLKASGAGG